MDKNVVDYSYLLDEFGEDKIQGRCNWLKELISSFIEQNDLTNYVCVSDSILFHVIIDYFADVQRLKKFQHIKTTNHIKVFSYISYWVLRHKPIQIRSEIDENNVFINEKFVSELIRSFLFDNPDNVSILKQDEDSINNFLDTMLYFFKYRHVTPQFIELMLISFNAGRGYQHSVDYQN